MRKYALFILIILFATGCKAKVTPTLGNIVEDSVTVAPSAKAIPPKASVTATQQATTQAVILTARASLNVRVCPGTACAVIGGLQEGDQVRATGINGDWYQISYGTGSGWVYGDNVSVSGDTASLEAVKLPTSPPSVPRATSSGASTRLPAGTRAPAATRPPATPVPVKTSVQAACRGLSLTCAQLTCAQAYACLAAGNRSLDRDGDGIPCESICK